MRILDLVEALIRYESVRVDDLRTVVVLDVGLSVPARFVVLEGDKATEPMTMGAAVSTVAAKLDVTMAEAFVVDALRESDADASSSYLARALDGLRQAA